MTSNLGGSHFEALVYFGAPESVSATAQKGCSGKQLSVGCQNCTGSGPSTGMAALEHSHAGCEWEDGWGK